MQRVGNLIPQIADVTNLYLAFYKACKGKRNKQEVREFSEKLEQEILLLREQLLIGCVPVGDYYYFKIHDPKLRIICAASFRERVLHHAIMNVCHPYFERQLIYSTYATRPHKGTYQAMDLAQKGLRNYEYVAKFDFRHYFDSISHEILLQKLEHIFKDKTLIALFASIINSYHTQPGYGIPIGNLSSQYFANYYLSSLDHYIKEQLQVKIYARYMDDFVVFAHSMYELKQLAHQINDYAQSELHLTLKPVIFLRNTQGLPFLGYKLYPHKKLLTARSKRRLLKKLRIYDRLLESGEWSEHLYATRTSALLAFAQHACVKGLLRTAYFT